MNNRTPHPIEKTAKVLIAIFVAVATILVAFAIISYAYFTTDIPSVDTLKTYGPPTVTKFYSDDGEVIGEFFTEKREVIPLSRMPHHLIQAFVAGEDARFFQHRGIDYVAILRALSHNIFSGEIVEGGSTITQQVVKSLLLTPEKSFSRKLREAILAYRIEKYLSKEEILFLYLNQIYLGHGAYGVATAAETYFGKRVEELNLAECALLAGLTQAPSRNSPFHNPDQAKKRQAYVLERMADEGFISSEDLVRVLRAPLRLKSSSVSPSQKAPYFVEHVRKYIEEKYGKDALYAKGLRVYTTVDLEMQKTAEDVLELGIKEIEKRHKYGVQTASASLEGALISFDLDTGYVKALVGGRDYRRSQFNRVTQARRQTGSAFKPIVYAAAMDRHYTPASIIVDSPILFQWGNKQWRPKNFEREFRGAITVRNALTHSVNVVTVKIAQDLGVDYLLDYARNLGISSPLHRDLSMALGSSALSLFELTKAYGVFANEGKTLRPIIVKKILDQHGNLLEENPPLFLSQESLEDLQVISPQTAYLMTNLLQSVVQDGTGWRAKSLGRPVAGKTGTTDQFCDAWFIGYTPELLTGVWVGFDEERSLGENETGSRAASPIWVNFMSKVLKDRPVQDFFIPDGIDFIEIDPRTGDLSSGREGFLECFKEGTGPGQMLHAGPMGSADFFKLDVNLSSRGN